ncbi:acetyl-CoA C-acyltransferase [Microbulbifer hydrolyticus]|uniref:Acetyl-CoA C-acetyltransferase n=1 Tax=Microbulbifer hydrolyticus TaxID=48074 RepID=A0A6P1TAR3_9GAMM|nr:acetyl-CoA C-acyltransferase [Microbulbifer hydrolyticus]MBB5212178.1 acetyl-CoA C-acetyltransferase [Microbulbifer hydrolyticus]QHQ39844.1 acetyl-CoA C-acyltransferase [Microbulbifer hydrolyticus]
MSEQVTDPVVIVGISRTPMGAMQGALSGLSAPELGAVAIRGALADAGVAAADVDEVLMGCVLPAGLGQAPARQASLGAGIPEGTPTTTVNKVCGSGMKTVMMARNALLAGEAKVVVAGGMESMSNAPYLLPKARAGMRLGHSEVLDHMFTDGLENAYDGQLMGNFAECTADKYAFTREEQDAFALESLARANAAIESGAFTREISPVTISTRKGEVEVSVDEGPGSARPDKIPQLRPAFRKDGTVTAANASSISDGAAALVLMRESEAKARGVRVLAVLKGQSQFAHEPEWFTTAPVSAMTNLLKKTGWDVADVDLFEINEAFAVVTMAAMKDLELSRDKVNVNGGACALGHPLGASGARVIVTLLAALEGRDLKKGVASLCIGGGEATAVAIERP